MNYRILAALAFGSLLAVSTAMAATTDVKGTIKTIDQAGQSVTLSDGTTYMLPKDFKSADFKVGEAVMLTWEMKGTVHQAVTMIPAG